MNAPISTPDVTASSGRTLPATAAGSPSYAAPVSAADPSAHAGTAVLLINLGTPDAPEPGAVGRYLTQFLSDPRVVEIPALLWQPLLRGVIVPLRSRASAKKYATVWMEEGSPLRVYTERQTLALRARFAELGLRVRAEYAMRYGTPDIGARIRALQADGIERILLLPLYPQYSASTTATAFDAAFDVLRGLRDQPALRVVKSYPTDPGYIAALAEQVARYWREHGALDFAAGDKLLLSFHGVPKRTITLGDPYEAECQATGARLAEVLGLDADVCRVTFQSRFGKAEWLQPYTEPTAVALAQAGTRRLDVFTPGFPADCLETIEEIGLEVRDAFLEAGGQTFRRIPCLNDAPAWIAGLATLCADNLAGWPGGPTR